VFFLILEVLLLCHNLCGFLITFRTYGATPKFLGEPNLRPTVHVLQNMTQYYAIFDTRQYLGLSKKSQLISTDDCVN